MLLLRTLAPWLLFAFLAQQVSPSSGAREKGRKGTVEDQGAERKASAAASRAQRGGKVAARKGTFSKDKMQCTWAARENGEVVKLGIHCKNEEARITGGVTELRCEYNAKPASCPGYGSDPAGFWKQVTRALKKMRNELCHNNKALVKARMCKRAPRDAHFKLDIRSAVASAQQPGDTPRQPETPRTPSATTITTAVLASGGPTTGKSCTEHVDQRKLAEEYCSSSWASLCTFFFSMVQSDEC